MYTYLHNSYNTPAMLYLENGDHILSQEGVTQRYNAAMAMYALTTWPLIQALSNKTANDEVKQVWYADDHDSSAVGSLAGVKKWWEYLQANGPDFGYCPIPAKTILLIRQQSNASRTKNRQRWWNQNFDVSSSTFLVSFENKTQVLRFELGF